MSEVLVDESQPIDMVNNPPHYNQRSTQCIDFTRHMDFTLGNAFKYAWRIGFKDDNELELGKIHWYVRDALAYRPATLHKVMLEILVRKLIIMKSEFDSRVWNTLFALLHAAAGDYDPLNQYVLENRVLTDEATLFLFGDTDEYGGEPVLSVNA